MEIIRENDMRFDPDDHNRVEKTINGVEFRTATWIKDHRTLRPDNRVNVIFNVTTGQASTSIMVDSENINALIELLQLTQDNIKAAEIELLALQTKVAA